MNIPEKLFYTSEHEWIKVEGEQGRIGITDYAQHHLGDIVFAELPELDETFAMSESLGVVESVKAVSSIFCPVGGTVIEVNEALESAPELINEDPYENWIAIIKITDSSELDKLMSAEAYAAYCQTLED
ncbi:MAG: glycine cleavage system protein GcvH [Syntrophomonas sp.]|nr:glycine cleavage system protein GcvH [Syntrophomonas sp.]